MTGYEWFLAGWWMLWAAVLIGGVAYAVKEARRHKREARRIKREARRIKRVPLADRWWKLVVE